LLVDSHCHLDFPDFGAELDAVLARAADAGIGTMQTICTRVTQFDGVLSLAETHPKIWCSVGVHPHHVAEEPEVTTAHLVGLAAHPKVIGIGETGLDFFYDTSPRAAQEASFRRHIAAARETGLPLIVHTRDADQETNRILREEAEEGPFPGVIHCFSTGREVAETALDLGLYVSLSGILTFKKAEELREIAADLPLDRVLVETDAPYLAPVPHRGKRNEPAFVRQTAERLAEIKQVAPEEIAEITTANFFRLFSKATI
jgi:TatD DNase family protein